jgi:outer membrane lipoprotein LolB
VRRLFLLMLCAVPAVIAGCATPGVPQALPLSNADIHSFALRGRVAVKVETRGYSANLRWRHTASGDFLTLVSPVGSVIAELEADTSGATLRTGDQKLFHSQDVQALTREILGWDLPLAGLRHWVVGRADPDSEVMAQSRDERDRLTSLTQDGWRISYLEYAGNSALPAKLALAYEDLKLRLIVDRWDLPE